MVCGDPESGTDPSLKKVSATLFDTGYTHGASRVNVIVCALLCLFTNNIHVNVKNSSAESTCPSVMKEPVSKG